MPLFNTTWAAKTNAAMKSNSPRTSSLLKSNLSSQGKSLKWIKVNNTGNIECLEEVGKDILSPLGRTRDLNFVSIMGAARGGKSFLANQLAKQDGLFKISNSADPCTTGIDICQRVLPATVFGSNSSSCVALLDVEGQGDRSMEYDSRLATVVLSLSKVVLFNWRDGLQVDRILNLLAVYQRASHNIDLGDDDGPPFNHLHIVFRDWNFQGKNSQDVKESLLGMEKRAQSQEAMLRNELRRTLVSAFASISVWLFPPPVSNTADLTRELGASDMSPEFTHRLDKLRAELGDQLSEPTLFGGKTLTGTIAQALVPKLVHTLNSGEVVFPRSAYLNMLHQEVEALCQAAESRAEAMMATARSECDASPQKQCNLSTEVHSAIEEYMSVFQSEVNALAGAGGEGVKEQCRLLKEFLDRSINDILRYNESALLKHLKSGMKEALDTFESSFIQSAHGSLPISENQLRSMYNVARKNALEVVRAIPATCEGVDEAVRSVSDSMELQYIRLEAENTAKMEASRSALELTEIEALEIFRKTFSCDVDSLRQTGSPTPPSKLQVIFQHAIDKAHLYANKKGCTTLGASRKFKAESHDILQRELKVAERETTLTVVAAMESVKTALLKEMEGLTAVLPIAVETLQRNCESMDEFAVSMLKEVCEAWEMNAIRVKEQENLLLRDTAAILNALKERNSLLLLQAKVDTNSVLHGQVTKSLRKEAEDARKAEVAAIEAEAIANAHTATCQAEMVAARIQADAHAAEKARAEKSLASIKQDRLVKELKEAESLAISKIATAKAITAEGGEGGTKKESRVVVEKKNDETLVNNRGNLTCRNLVVEEESEEEEEPLKKKLKVDYSVITLPPNANEVECARMKSDYILKRTSCGGGRGRDSIEDARKEAIEAREAREGLAATAVIESGSSRNNHRKVGADKQQCKSHCTPPVRKAKEGLTTAACATTAIVRTEGSSHEKDGDDGTKQRIKPRHTVTSPLHGKYTTKNQQQPIATNKQELLRAAREAAREAICQQQEASVKAVKKGKKKSNTISQ